LSQLELSMTEQKRRKEIVKHARGIVLKEMLVEAQDETSLMLTYRGYYLQISFSELHPLMVFCLAKALPKAGISRQCQVINELNLHSVLGSHAINNDIGCYSYRATHWLDTQVDIGRFYEILDRCVDEAQRGYLKLAS